MYIQENIFDDFETVTDNKKKHKKKKKNEKKTKIFDTKVLQFNENENNNSLQSLNFNESSDICSSSDSENFKLIDDDSLIKKTSSNDCTKEQAENQQAVDAYVDIFYEAFSREIQLTILSILNKINMPLFEINIVVNIFQNNTLKKSINSKKEIKKLLPLFEEQFGERFVLKFTEAIELEKTEVDITIMGKYAENEQAEKTTLSQFCVDGRNIKIINNNNFLLTNK